MKKVMLLLTLCTLYTLHTQNTLSQWYQQQVPTSQLVQDIHFLDTLHGWLACSNGSVNDSGIILYTSTGGTSWVKQLGISSSPLFALKMANLNTGYCVGGFRKIYKTTDGGINWLNMNTGFANYFGDVAVPNTNGDTAYFEDFTSGEGIWKTTNGGLTFANIYPPAYGRTLFFINNQTGWAEIGSFYLVHTTNGGQNWTTLQNFASPIGDIFFVNENTGWVIGGDSTGVLKTTNGGVNFIAQQLPSRSSGAFGIFMIDSQNGWIGSISLKIHKNHK